MLDLIIIGAGPAGMTAAIYAARQKMDMLLITRDFGGQWAKKEVQIENYPGMGKISALELVNKFKEHLNSCNAPIKIGEVIKLEKIDNGFVVSTEKEKFQSRAVIVASGFAPKLLNIAGEKEMLGRGVSYCVTCDGPVFSGRDVAVIGSSDSAFESAEFLAKFVKKVYIIENRVQVRAAADRQAAARQSGKIEIITDAKPLRVQGNKFVNQLVYLDQKSSQEINLPVEGVFIKAGNQPAASFIADLADINERNEIKFDRQTCQTKTAGLFVAGDVGDTKYKQIVIAAGAGANAALCVDQYLKNN